MDRRLARPLIKGSIYAVGAGVSAGLALGFWRASEPQPLPPQPESFACKVVPQWLGKQTLRVTVSDPSLAPNESITGVNVIWGDDVTNMESPIDFGPSETTRSPMSATHTYAKAGEYSIQAVVNGQGTEGQATYELSSSPGYDPACQLTVTVPH